MEKVCLDCGQALLGRADKKFCNDQCRNNYNNRLNSDSAALVKSINNHLKKNRRILAELNPDGKVNVHKDKLVKLGFSFSYITHVYVTRNGSTYRFVYDYGYLPLDNDFYMLVRRDPTK